jgi:bifunctional DNA-binding transcriptional regulator/antitoxin component of YhaV-PrlF toxin-antitoxin module
MGEKIRFFAVIEQSEGGGAYVTIPFDVVNTFGKKRVPVQASIDGEPYRGSLVRMGSDCHILGILKEIRERVGKQVGDSIEIVVEEDVAPRVVEIPADLQVAFDAAPQAKEFFATLSYSRQREYVLWIEEAKRAQTRAERIERAIEMLALGQKLK